MNISKIKVFSLYIVFAFLLITQALANNLIIDNLSLGSRNPKNNTVVVQFDISWENSWKTKINHDAVWVTVRLEDPSVIPSSKNLCLLTNTGLNPSNMSVGSNTDFELYVPSDSVGAFIRRKNNSFPGAVSSNSVQLSVDYSSCGFDDNSDIYASVFGLEMVYVPEGAFYAGDYGTSYASFVQGSSDNDPWYISSEMQLGVANVASNGFYYQSAGNSGEVATGSSFSVPDDYPKGFASFYAMKYEITEEQWVEFVNSLSSTSARSNKDLTNALHKNSDAVIDRNTISCIGFPASCSTERPSRPVSFLSWMDFASFLDWAGLRPMTELEFEKLSRGAVLPYKGEYAWGNADIVAADVLSGVEEDGQETILTVDANANYGNSVFTGGDSSQGVEHQTGPVRSGIFSTASSTRQSAGAGKFGAMELSGNLKEWVVTLGNAEGLSFRGSHGDGYLVNAAGYEGNANVLDWPGIDEITTRGVTGAVGSGLRGGSWSDSVNYLRISDRSEAALTTTVADSSFGGRGVRTDDSN